MSNKVGMFSRTVIAKILRPVVCVIPRQWIAKILQIWIYIFSQFYEPDKALRFLLSIHSMVYRSIGKHAIRYGNGVHVKHRMTGYVEILSSWAVDHPGPYLDVGCNIGEISRAVAGRTAAKVVGLDISPEVIQKARDRSCSPNLQFICGDTNALDSAEVFETVILSNVLEHIEDRIGFLASLRRDQGAKNLIVRVPNYERDWLIPLRQELGLSYFSDPTHYIEHRPEELRHELAQAGLAVSREEHRWGEIWLVASARKKEGLDS